MSKAQVVSELWQFMKENKKYWLAPIVITLVLFGILLVLAKSSAIAPFIYTLLNALFNSDSVEDSRDICVLSRLCRVSRRRRRDHRGRAGRALHANQTRSQLSHER